jgi:hypothetical protein
MTGSNSALSMAAHAASASPDNLTGIWRPVGPQPSRRFTVLLELLEFLERRVTS